MADSPELKTLVSKIGELPTLPSVVHRINQLLSNPRTSANEVGIAIASDQVIASKVLKLVNSAFYGFPGRINTISHAIVILGFSTVKNIVLTTSIIGALSSRKDGFDMAGLWKHSIAVGALSKLLAKECGSIAPEEAFISGLLHDIGKVVLAIHVPEHFAKVMAACSSQRLCFHEAENKLFGVTHCDVGIWLTSRWNLPGDLSATLAHHHSPSRAGRHQEICAIVQVADILARALGEGEAGDKTVPLLDPVAWNSLGLDRPRLDRALSRADDEIEKASIFLKV